MPRANRIRIILLLLMALILLVGILSFSTRILPNPPLEPTATFPEGIDYPNDRPRPYP